MIHTVIKTWYVLLLINIPVHVLVYIHCLYHVINITIKPTDSIIIPVNGWGCYESEKFPRGGGGGVWTSKPVKPPSISVHVHVNVNTFIHIFLLSMQIKLYLHISSPILVSKINSVHQYFVVLEHIFEKKWHILFVDNKVFISIYPTLRYLKTFSKLTCLICV